MDNMEIKDVDRDYDEDEDDDLNNLLISWSLSHVLYNLQDESVTIDVLQIMDYDQLQELTNSWKLGDRVNFIFNFKKWREEINLPLSNEKDISKSSDCLSPLNDPNPSPNLNQTTTNDKDDVLSINVVDILNGHKMGCKIMQIYKINKNLTNDQRNLLICIIAQFFQKKDMIMSLQTSYRLENQLLELFESEKIEFYRTERRGKLYTKFSNMRTSAKRSLDEENLPPSKLSKNDHTPSNRSKRQFEPEEDAKMMAQSIQYDNLSAEDFKSAWCACSQYRLHQIFNECHNIGDILNIWPQYRKPNGYKLIDKDFKSLYKTYDSIMNWNDKMVNLFKFLKQSKLILGQDQKLLEDMHIEDSEKDKDKFAFKVLWALHYYLYPTGKTVKKNLDGKKIYNRFTTKDSHKSFLYIKPTMQALEEHIDNLNRKRQSIQPFILAEGTFEKINHYFVYFDGTRLPFSNYLRSLDICFKVFHLFNVEYPKPSESFWTFIEHYFFEIENSKKISKVSILIKNLKK